jgi:purine-binding chemotaxis protein CheW
VPDLLTFALGDQRFALPSSAVTEIVRLVAAARLPGAPDIVEGVVNLRGRLVPVLDVRARFGVPPAEPDPDQHLIVARAGLRLVALRVDRALELVSVAADAIEPTARVAPGVPLVKGCARLADGVLVIHDLERFLSLDAGVRLDAALSDAGGR